MTTSVASAEVKANVDVRPTHSQGFLVAALILAAFIFACSTFLFISGFQIPGYVFAVVAALVAVIGFIAWTKSQHDIDLDQGHPTSIALPDGTKILTDGRTLRSLEGLRGLSRLCDEVLNRQPLPEPEGLVNANAQVVPNSKEDAIALTNKINSSTQANTNAFIDALGLETASDVSHNLTQQVAAPSDRGPDEVFPKNLNIIMSDPT